jgi:hypothetical protein
MTSITAAANLGWEVAGAKKNPKKLSPEAKKTNAKGTAAATTRLPKVETLAPMRVNSSIYDHLQESGDDSDEHVNYKSKNKMDNRVPSLMHHEPKLNTPNAKATASPKAAKQAETINLLASSIATNKKKAASPSAGKNVNVEFENALGQVNNLVFRFLIANNCKQFVLFQVEIRRVREGIQQLRCYLPKQLSHPESTLGQFLESKAEPCR